LPQQRVRRLEEEGIGWRGLAALRKAQERIWDRMFEALRAFRRRAGHLRVPRGWKDEPSLAAWLASQRHLRRKGALTPSRRKRLDELDADWHQARSRPQRDSMRPPSAHQRDAAWERGFAALRRYRDRTGHCNVPARSAADPALARWVTLQRYRHRRGKLDADRVDRLQALGFVWSGRDVRRARGERRWEACYAELVEYRRRVGHCAVEMNGKSGPRLARWVSAQRTAFKAGRLDASRKQRLDAAGFLWSARA
jgi:hypothetical protein